MKIEKRISRRQFGKIAGAAAIGAAVLPALGLPAPAQEPAPGAQPKLKLDEKQEAAVKQAIERRERQIAAMRSRALPYDLEPAFVFEVRRRPRAPAKKGA